MGSSASRCAEKTAKIKYLKKLQIAKENHRNQAIPVIFGGDYWTRTRRRLLSGQKSCWLTHKTNVFVNFCETLFGSSKGQVCTFVCTSVIDSQAFQTSGTRPSHLRGRAPAAWTPSALPGTPWPRHPRLSGTAGPHSCAASRGVSAAGGCYPDPGGAPEGTPEKHGYRHP